MSYRSVDPINIIDEEGRVLCIYSQACFLETYLRIVDVLFLITWQLGEFENRCEID